MSGINIIAPGCSLTHPGALRYVNEKSTIKGETPPFHYNSSLYEEVVMLSFNTLIPSLFYIVRSSVELSVDIMNALQMHESKICAI